MVDCSVMCPLRLLGAQGRMRRCPAQIGWLHCIRMYGTSRFHRAQAQSTGTGSPQVVLRTAMRLSSASGDARSGCSLTEVIEAEGAAAGCRSTGHPDGDGGQGHSGNALHHRAALRLWRLRTSHTASLPRRRVRKAYHVTLTSTICRDPARPSPSGIFVRDAIPPYR